MSCFLCMAGMMCIVFLGEETCLHIVNVEYHRVKLAALQNAFEL